MAKTATRSVELEPIDRLEEKVKLLVGHGRADEGRTGAARPKRTSGCRTRSTRCARALASSEALATELSTLKEERDVIRTRVSDMLEQLEALNL